MNHRSHVPVKSSNLKSVVYDPKTQALEVHFKSGDTYLYANVPRQVHEALLSAPSKGKFLRSAIAGKFRGVKI